MLLFASYNSPARTRKGSSPPSAPELEMFGWMTLLGAGLLPVSAGLDTARWATALEMDKAQSMLFERYRNFWAAQFKRMVRIVLLFKERFDNMKFADKSADVSVDTFSLADFPAVAKTIGQLVRDALAPLIDNGAIEPEDARPILAELWRISLQALGVSKAQDLTSDEAFGIGQEEEPGQEEQEAITQIATIIEQNARDGVIDWENVAQWALEELRE